MNTRLLREVQKAIVEHPAHFDMGIFGHGLKADELFHEEPPESACGTAACIAGYTVALSAGRTPRHGSIATKAARLLGIAYDGGLSDFKDEGSRLFYVDEWPARFARRYQRASRNVTRARIASERIDHFIKTEGAE